jgi:quercetin dioxygenase-like cupin family protein
VYATVETVRGVSEEAIAKEAFVLADVERWDAKKHVERILGKVGDGDYIIACWEPGQISPHHSHPDCTEIYLCLSGGGTMNVPGRSIDIIPGAFLVHPPGELHEFVNGDSHSDSFRVRYGGPKTTRIKEWQGNSEWKPTSEDIAYFEKYPRGEVI